MSAHSRSTSGEAGSFADPLWVKLTLVALAAVYVGAWIASPIVTNSTRSDLDIFFWPAAQLMVHGNPFGVYSLPPLGLYPVANGPLGLVILVPPAALANLWGIDGDLHARAALAGAAAGIFALLLAYEAFRLIQMARGRIPWPLATLLVFLGAPALWIGVADFGHVEQPLELWLVLAATRQTLGRRYVLAGILLGLALLTRTTAVLYLIPLVAISLAGGKFRATVQTLAGAGLTGAAGIAPFLIVDRANTIHALIGYRGALRIAGGTLWFAMANSAVAPLVQHGDTYLVIGAAATACALVVWGAAKSVSSPAGMAGLLTVVALSFPMLAKTSFPYYLMEAYMFSAVWWLARHGSAWNWRLAAPLLITADVFFGKWAETLPAIGTPYVQEGIASSALLALVAALVIADLLRGRGRQAVAGKVGRQPV